jgi:zinc-ribbon domain
MRSILDSRGDRREKSDQGDPMNRCPNCGWSNDEANRFCENCGADLDYLRTTGGQRELPESNWPTPPPRPMDPAPERPTSTEVGAYGDWQMAPLPPQEEIKSKRKTWLWVLGIMMLVGILFCAGAVYWLGYTDSGAHFQTEVAVRETEQADK